MWVLESALTCESANHSFDLVLAAARVMMQVIITLFMATEYRSPFRRAKQRLRDLLVAGLWVAAAADGLASTLTVTSVNDSGVGSLRPVSYTHLTLPTN